MPPTNAPPPRRGSPFKWFVLGILLGAVLAIAGLLYLKHKAETEPAPLAPETTVKVITPLPAPEPMAPPPKPTAAQTAVPPAAARRSPEDQVADDAAAVGMTSVAPPPASSAEPSGEPATN